MSVNIRHGRLQPQGPCDKNLRHRDYDPSLKIILRRPNTHILLELWQLDVVYFLGNGDGMGA